MGRERVRARSKWCWAAGFGLALAAVAGSCLAQAPSAPEKVPAAIQQPTVKDGEAPTEKAGEQTPPGVPVMVDGREILRIYEPIGPFSAEMRAKSLEARIEALGKDPSYDESALTTAEGHGGTEFLYRGGLMGLLTDDDAKAQGVTREELAERLLRVTREAIGTYREEHSTQALTHNVLFAVLAVSALVLALFLTRIGHRWLEKRVDQWCGKDGWIGKQKALGMVGHIHLARAAIAGLRILRLVLALVFVYVALATVFSLFPWTRELAGILASYGMDPLRALWGGFLKYIPNLLFIAVIFIVAYFASRLLRWFFDRIGAGEITVSWIDPEWAPAYYRILRTVVLIGVVVIIFPYIPGSSTPAFKGISIFLGALATFGSSTAISNLVNGLVLMTMRPYHAGDWVRVGDTEGQVLEVSLLVTRLRTPKNVVVTVPSSQVVGSHILNFSEEAKGGPGLILHTTVTIGYDAPWRTVHGLMVEAALKTRGVLAEPSPFVLQTSLDDSYVSYQINAFTREALDQPRLYSELHQNIQEAFNAAGVEIMSPAYQALRDGNTVTIPAAQRPAGYEPRGFRVEGK